MIRFQTQRFGSLEVGDDRIITFPKGLLGFEEVKRYILIDYKDTPLKWLQAVDDPNIAFIVVEPRVFLPHYSIEIDTVTRRLLQIERDDDIAVLIILRVDQNNVIANLHGPLIINSQLMIGSQIVLH